MMVSEEHRDAMVDVESPDRFLNRELSWLEFNARVLAQAKDASVPLLERVKFCAIFSTNLDEFFQVRIAGLKEQVAAGNSQRSFDGRTPERQLEEIGVVLREQLRTLEELWVDQLLPALASENIHFLHWDRLSAEDRQAMSAFFFERVYPVLTPLSVDPGHPFPYISDLSLNLAVLVRDTISGERRFARVKVPPLLPRFVKLPGDGDRYFALEELIATHMSSLFEGMEVVEQHTFRVTRNADFDVEEKGAEDLLEAVDLGLRRRRFAQAVRLVIAEPVASEAHELLKRELDLHPEDVYVVRIPLDLGGLFSVYGIDRPDLKYAPWTPLTPFRMAETDEERADLFAELKREDILVHHPYASFATTVEEFIRVSAVDPHVLAIKIAMYRTAEDSSIVRSLIRAADRGKQVVALVELKARFDEEANIEWAKRLEQAGVHVVYGLVGLKTHAKVALVVRDEETGLRRYCHFGTGNYNSKTARIYSDLGLLTADHELGADLSQLFNHLTGYSRDVEYRRILVAPDSLRTQIEALIEGEMNAAPGTGRIVMKLNSISDPKMIDALTRASQAGVEIDLIVRGICCLRPGAPGYSDRIRVRSLIGRYLEHSRILYFANGEGPGRPAYYMGSADMMRRNLNRRVEALVPIMSLALRERIHEVLQTNLDDDSLSWHMHPDGSYTRVPAGAGIDTHLVLQELESQRGRPRTPRMPKLEQHP